MNILEQIKVCAMTGILMSAAIIDFRTGKIPNVFVKSTLIIRTNIFIPEFLFSFNNFKISVLSSFIGLVVPLIVLLILSAITRDGLGMGDIKILSVLGYMMGLESVLYTLFYGMLFCGFYIMILKKWKRTRILKTPLGPFIFIGFLFSIFHRIL